MINYIKNFFGSEVSELVYTLILYQLRFRNWNSIKENNFHITTRKGI